MLIVKQKYPKKRYISPEGRQQIIDELRLLSRHNNGIQKNSKFVKKCIKSLGETGGLIDGKIADKITNASKNSLTRSQNDDANS